MIDYPLVNDDLALLWMVNMGCIDLNAWTSRVDRPDRPDWVIFDLDPSDDVGFPEVIEVALLVKQTLDLVGLASFPKTSGSKGIHVLVPVARRHGYDETRTFASIVAGALARAQPGLVTTEWTKRKRRGVLVDANQNGPGRTTATVYSVRPRPGAPVRHRSSGTRCGRGSIRPCSRSTRSAPAFARHGDLFAPVLRSGSRSAPRCGRSRSDGLTQKAEEPPKRAPAPTAITTVRCHACLPPAACGASTYPLA